MICGLVGITPAAGFVNGLGAIIIGLVASAVVWTAWYTLPKYVWPFNKVDDALGVVYTHGIAGLLGGLLVGLLADPNVLEYPAAPGGAAFGGAGWIWGHHRTSCWSSSSRRSPSSSGTASSPPSSGW